MKHEILIKKLSLLLLANLFAIACFAQSLTDSEIKKNVNPLTLSLQKLVQLEPKTFEFETAKYKHLKLQHGKKFGFLAENVQGVLPELVSERSTSYMFGKNSYRNVTYKTIDESALIPLLVASIKEQQQQIEQLKAAVEELRAGKTAMAN